MDQNNGKFFTLYHGKDIYLELWVDMGDDEKIVTFVDAPFYTGSHATCYLDMSRNNWQPPYFGSEEGFAAWKAGGSFRAIRDGRQLPFVTAQHLNLGRDIPGSILIHRPCHGNL